MAITWGDIQTELEDLIVSEDYQSGGKMHSYLLKWTNRVITQICTEIDIRYHLQDATLTLTTSDSSVSLPSDYFKFNERFIKLRDGDDEYVPIIGLELLNEYDPDHDDTGSSLSAVAIEGHRLYVYPMVSMTVTLENYFRKPTAITTTVSDEIDLPGDSDDNTLIEMVLAGVMRKVMARQQDFDMVNYYTEEWKYWLELYRVYIDNNKSHEKLKAPQY